MSNLNLTVRKMGNSLGVRFPAALARMLTYTEGAQLEVSTQGATLMLKPKKEAKALFPKKDTSATH